MIYSLNQIFINNLKEKTDINFTALQFVFMT